MDPSLTVPLLDMMVCWYTPVHPTRFSTLFCAAVEPLYAGYGYDHASRLSIFTKLTEASSEMSGA